MRILIVHNPQIKDFPPVRNLLENLLKHGHQVTIITKDDTHSLKEDIPNLKVIRLESYSASGVSNMLRYFKNQKYLQKLVIKEMEHHDILWTTTDTTVRALKDVVLNYKHVMQLMELIEDIPLFPGQSLFKLNIKKYAKKAWKVVVPEYNRAHIQKTWWELRNTPIILPNKPYSIPEPDTEPAELTSIIQEMKQEKRKIVLYQGVFYGDRNLDAFAEAVESLKDEYCLYIMGKDNELRRKLCETYSNIKYVPFVQAPNHLLITRQADVGLLPYIPTKTFHYSELNALYCAPNKIYEYAAFGLPMIGSDVPGLAEPFNKYGMGICCKKLTASEVRSALCYVSEHFEEMKKHSIEFYDGIDLNRIVNEEILEA